MVRRLDELLDAIRALSEEERAELVDQLQQDQAEKCAVDPASVIGLFSDQAELVDEVCESAMLTRERDQLRPSDG